MQLGSEPAKSKKRRQLQKAQEIADLLNKKVYRTEMSDLLRRILEVQARDEDTKLRHLDLSSYSEITTDHILWQVAQNCPELTSITLSDCNNVTALGLRSLSMGLGYNLESINLSKCGSFTDAFIGVLTVRFYALKLINLSYCSQISNTALQSISRGCSSTLESLNLSFCTQVPS